MNYGVINHSLEPSEMTADGSSGFSIQDRPAVQALAEMLVQRLSLDVSDLINDLIVDVSVSERRIA